MRGLTVTISVIVMLIHFTAKHFGYNITVNTFQTCKYQIETLEKDSVNIVLQEGAKNDESLIVLHLEST